MPKPPGLSSAGSTPTVAPITRPCSIPRDGCSVTGSSRRTVSGYRQLLGWLGRHGQVGVVGVEGTGSYGAGLAQLLGGPAGAGGRGRPARPADPPPAGQVGPDRRRGRRPRGAGWHGDRGAQAARRDRRGDPRAADRPPGRQQGPDRGHQPAQGAAGHRASPGPRGARRPLRRRRWSPPAPGSDPTRLVWPTRCTPARQRCKRSPSASSCSRPSSNWLTSGWRKLVGRAAPRLLGLLAIGNDHAGQLLVTAGQHPERLRGEAAFAHLCGVAPIPASSGKTRRHRLHRGGDRDANRALHLAVVVRMRFCPRTRAYVERRTKEGLSKPEIMRCIKRYLAREVYHALVADFEALHAT